ncbi:UNVERIFIED_CONTAM: hypothetical protein RMT77_004192 [Armadillidium vulgare]
MFIEIVLLSLIILIIWNEIKKPSNYPPGPWGLPLIGHIPFNISKIESRLEEMKEKHGNIFSWRIGSRIFVFLCDPKQIKEAFQSPSFADRPHLRMFSLYETDLGIVISNGIHWQNIRRFTLRHLRDLGMGKSKFVSHIHYEAADLIKVMKKQAGIPAPVPKALTPAVSNVIWQLVAGIRQDLDNQEVLDFDKLFQQIQENAELIMIQDFFPWVQNILPESLFNFITKKHIHSKTAITFKTKFMEIIDDHIKTLDENDPRDYIDDYLIEMEKQKDDPSSTMSYEDLITCVSDLFVAGMESTTPTIYFAIFYLASFPEVQRKVQKELDEVLPNGTLFTLADKPRLPYTEAFITEVLRYSSLGSLGVFRTVQRDTSFGGYTIPKGAIVGSLAYSIHSDDKYFDSPKEFRPERYLNSDGKFEVPKENFIPFGTGKRQCLGETLARMELFIFLTAMLQELQFSVPPNKTLDLSPNVLIAFHQPKIDQDILITVRN